MKVDDLKESDGAYPGKEIFNFFFNGTRFKDYRDYKGSQTFEGLAPNNFGHWNYIFERCMSDLIEK